MLWIRQGESKEVTGIFGFEFCPGYPRFSTVIGNSIAKAFNTKFNEGRQALARAFNFAPARSYDFAVA